MSDHIEQETIDHLKAWWARWGKVCSWVLAAALAISLGWNSWGYWQRQQATRSEKLYEQFQQIADWPAQSGQAIDKARLIRIVDDMKSNFGRTPYAQMTALAAAKVLYQMADTANAKKQLEWTIKHAIDAEYQQVARLRLASLLLDEKAYDAALKVLSIKPLDAFRALYADRRGDLLVTQNKLDEARQSYRKALQVFSSNDPLARITKFKLDALGG